MDKLAGGYGIADFESSIVGNTDNIAGESLVDNVLFLGHECGRSGKSHHFARAYVLVVGITLKSARAHLDECYT